jgi:lipopolysaccharide/colanic/teichoic acid biosynthesis glycosyltransferase
MEVRLKNLNELVELPLPQASPGAGISWSRRALDVAIAAVSLLLMLPVCLLIALLIKLDSRGPVLFTQTRMGRDGRCFKMIKFRSMHVNADEHLKEILAADPALRMEYETYHKLQKDPRVTRVGWLLRRFSLDELPQFWNVFRGEMSLVGPRPYLPHERHKMNGSERVILSVPPGITGYWQVHARNSVCFQDRLVMDLQYMQLRSLWLDLNLLSRTVVVVVRGEDPS